MRTYPFRALGAAFMLSVSVFISTGCASTESSTSTSSSTDTSSKCHRDEIPLPKGQVDLDAPDTTCLTYSLRLQVQDSAAALRDMEQATDKAGFEVMDKPTTATSGSTGFKVVDRKHISYWEYITYAFSPDGEVDVMAENHH